MTDDLVYRIFVEIAVLEGKRDVGGRWLIDDTAELQRTLKRAFTAVMRATVIDEDVSPKARAGGAKPEKTKA